MNRAGQVVRMARQMYRTYQMVDTGVRGLKRMRDAVVETDRNVRSRPADTTSAITHNGGQRMVSRRSNARLWRKRRIGRFRKRRGFRGKRGRGYGGRRRGIGGIRRLVADTRKRDELKSSLILNTNEVTMQVNVLNGVNALSSQRPLIESMGIGQGLTKNKFTGNQIQLRTLQMRAVLQTADTDVYVRWVLFRTKEAGAGANVARYPYQWLDRYNTDEAATGWVVLNDHHWNLPFRSGKSDEVLVTSASTGYTPWQRYLRIVKTGVVHLPNTVHETQFNINLKFRTGRRPIVRFYEAEGSWYPETDYVLVMWANEPYSSTVPPMPDTGAVLRYIVTQATFYDA